MLTKINQEQLNDKIIDGSKIVDNLELGGSLKLTSTIQSKTGAATTSSIDLNSGITATSTGDITLSNSSNKLYIKSTGLIGIGTNAPDASYNVTVNGNTKIIGNLDITGSLNYTSTEIIPITDNTLLLNSNWTAAATENAGLEVERGTYTNSKLTWDETSNYWSISTPADDANAATSYRIVDQNYGDGRYVNSAGDTMTGNISFTNIVSASSNGLTWTGLTDVHSIFVEEYSGGESTRLVIKSSDNGDSDYTVIRNNTIDVLEIRNTYIQANKNVNITDKKLTINGIMLSTQSETIPTYASGSNFHIYLKDSIHIHSSTNTGIVRLYSSSDTNYYDVSNDGTNFNITGSTANHTYYFRNSNGVLLSVGNTGVVTTKSDIVNNGDIYINTNTISATSGMKIGGASSGSTLLHNYYGTLIVANAWDWDKGGGIKANIANATLDIGTADKLGKSNASNFMTAGIRLLNNTEITGTLRVTSNDILLSDDKGITFGVDGGRLYKKSGAGMRLKAHNDGIGVTIADAADSDVFIIKKDVTTYNGLTYHGKKVWNEGNDGAGSGLDADTIDSKQATDLVLRDGTQAMTGLLTLSGDPTSVLNAVTKQYLDRKITFANVNALKATDPIDDYPVGATTIMKWNGAYGSWPFAAGLVVTYSSRDTGNDNQTGTLYPGSVHQIVYSESGQDIYHRVASVSMTFNSITVWSASTAVALNAYKMPTSTNENGGYYKCTTAGTTGTTEPTWPTSGTVTDGTVIWTYQGKFWSDWDRMWTTNTTTPAMIKGNLGYTPANIAGDTFTGDVRIGSNTVNRSLVVTGAILNDNTSGEQRVKIADDLWTTGKGWFDGSVGIGIDNGVTPSKALDVSGDIRLSGWIYKASGYLGFALDSGAAMPIKAGGMAVTDAYGETHPTNGLYVKGNVGIGIQAPTSALQVQGSSTTSDFIAIFNRNGLTPEASVVAGATGNMVSVQGSGSAFLMARDVTNDIEFMSGVSSGGEAFVGSMTSHNFGLRTGNVDRVLISASGNVGINQPSPQELLHLGGNIRGNLTAGALRVSTTSGTLDIGPQNSTYSHFNTDRGAFYFNKAITVDTGIISTFDDDISLQTATTTRMTILNSNGNVGIGIAAPTAKLQIDGGDIKLADTAGQTPVIVKGYSNGAALWVINTGSQGRINLADAHDEDRGIAIKYTPGTTGAGAGQLILGQVSKINANYTHGITSLYTNGLERLRVDVSGNTLIGTTTAVELLTVAGNLALKSNGDATYTSIVNLNTTTSPDLYIPNLSGATDTISVLGTNQTFTGAKTFSSNTYFPGSGIWDNTGNVGIGTNSPTSLLHLHKFVNSSAENWIITLQNNNTETVTPTAGILFDVGDTSSKKAGIIFRRTSSYGRGDLYFLNNNSGDASTPTIASNSAMVIKNTGYIGIGNTAPAQVLDVTGNIAVSGTVDGVDIAAHNHGGAGQGGTVSYTSLSNRPSPIREYYDIPVGGVASGTNITIPNSKSYTVGSKQLVVYLNGRRMRIDSSSSAADWDYWEVSTTQVKFNYPIPQGSYIEFEILIL